ncbi:MAG TPA: hypothetical protein VI432_00010 [Candidatus Paceibacterota bacterium]
MPHKPELFLPKGGMEGAEVRFALEKMGNDGVRIQHTDERIPKLVFPHGHGGERELIGAEAVVAGLREVHRLAEERRR